jgi:hypothetical protein
VRRTATAAALAAVLCTAGAAARAASPPDEGVNALPCRPTIACTADIVPPGALEVEAGYIYRNLHGAVNQQSLPFLAKLTVARWLQLQVGGNGPTFADRPVAVRYVDDIAAGLKLHAADQTAVMPSISFSAALSIPLPAAPGYVRTYDALFTAYFTKDFGWLHADLNLGFNVWRLERPIEPQPWAALALSAALGAGFTAMIEGYAFADAAPIAPKDAGLLAALAYAPAPWLVFDAGGDLGLIRSTRNGSAFIGLTVIPVKIW